MGVLGSGRLTCCLPWLVEGGDSCTKEQLGQQCWLFHDDLMLHLGKSLCAPARWFVLCWSPCGTTGRLQVRAAFKEQNDCVSFHAFINILSCRARVVPQSLLQDSHLEDAFRRSFGAEVHPAFPNDFSHIFPSTTETTSLQYSAFVLVQGRRKH